MTRMFYTLGALLAVGLTLFTASMFMRLAIPLPTDPANNLAALFTGLAIFVAILTFISSQETQSSKEYLSSAVELLSIAYEMFATNTDDTGYPKNDRRLWLSVARLIGAAKNVSSRISSDVHRTIWEEQEEYWKGRMFDLLFRTREGFPESYYAEKPDHMFSYLETDRPPLSENSIAIVFRFLAWKKGKTDPVSREPRFRYEEIHEMHMLGPRNFAMFMERVIEYEKKYGIRDRRKDAGLPDDPSIQARLERS